MYLWAIIGAVLILAAVVVNVMAIVMGFRESLKRGVIALLAPVLLGAGISMAAFVAHHAAMANVGAKEVQQQGEEEAQQQIDDLKNAENIDLGL
jgi:membrane protein implicated in regulation of membrane protease activity